ncbi:DNA-processing protein DprA [Brachybacterium huguangmaarense]|uniref:DNA-processing protein DprA n=1 Tax=Brachybacterium huguangmaarense TaxID=1652028 RepID=A0ABY6FYJ4_9MICO|nr:DNA-processing protein DprA [Brachybacterium huguangmaarense]UYG15493.1 DNA-processing protein DprA [Brachybacterium huguangmaarense]
MSGPAQPPAVGPSRAAEGAEARRARAAWSHLAEPTDAAAHLLCRTVGHVAALELVRDGRPRGLLAALAGVELPTEVADAASGGGHVPSAGARRVETALARWRARLAALDLDAELDRTARRGIRLLIPGDPEWPDALDDLGDTIPHGLWAAGPRSLAALVAPGRAVALVGSRACTPYGEDMACSLGGALADRGVCVVSGGAYGIDAAAHRGALSAPDGGGTLAVLAGGLDALYPRGNTRLLEAVRERHLLVSEAPCGTTPTRWRFLARNRLIAALTGATVVVEASWRSGALSTARHADDLSRPVGAVPGPVTSAASAGCHRLIRDRGAVLVTEAADVLELVHGGPPAADPGAARQDELDLLTPLDRRVLDGIPPRSWASLASLALECALAPEAVAAAVARLELLGLARTSGERVQRARRP